MSVTYGENGHHTVSPGTGTDTITLLNVSAATRGTPGDLDRALVVTDFTPGDGGDFLSLDPILAAYLGSLFVAGGFLAVGSFTSTITRNQLIAFLISVLICFLLLMAGYPVVTELFQRWAPQWLVDGVASLSFLAHFENIIKGVLDLRDVLYYALVITFFLLASTVVLDARKSN